MACEFGIIPMRAGELESVSQLLPKMRVPALCTTNLKKLLAFYRDALGFQVLQQVPGVLALLRHGSVRLQLWQQHCAAQTIRTIRIELEEEDVFQLHTRMARHERSATADEAPRLQPWGAWEFSLIDAEGNRLVFVQWDIAGLAAAHAQSRHGPGQ